MSKTSEEKAAIAIISGFSLWFLCVVAVNIAIIWTVVHFVRKYW